MKRILAALKIMFHGGKLKRVALNGDAIVFRVMEGGQSADRVFVRDPSQPKKNNFWMPVASYRDFVECHEALISQASRIAECDKITLPEFEERRVRERVLRIKIHDHEKLSAQDFGRVAAAYVKANGLVGHPVFGFADGTFEFVVARTQDEIEAQEKEDEERQSALISQILGLVRVELVTGGAKGGDGGLPDRPPA